MALRQLPAECCCSNQGYIKNKKTKGMTLALNGRGYLCNHVYHAWHSLASSTWSSIYKNIRQCHNTMPNLGWGKISMFEYCSQCTHKNLPQCLKIDCWSTQKNYGV